MGAGVGAFHDYRSGTWTEGTFQGKDYRESFWYQETRGAPGKWNGRGTLSSDNGPYCTSATLDANCDAFQFETETGDKIYGASSVCDELKEACPKLKGAAAFAIITFILALAIMIVSIVGVVHKPRPILGCWLSGITIFTSIISCWIMATANGPLGQGFNEAAKINYVSLVFPNYSAQGITMALAWPCELITVFMAIIVAAMFKRSAEVKTDFSQ